MSILSTIEINKELFDEVIDTGHEKIIFQYKNQRFSLEQVGKGQMNILIVGDIIQLPMPQCEEIIRIRNLALGKTYDEYEEKKKRYEVCRFPALYGDPVFTNSKTTAYIIAVYFVFRYIIKPKEIRIIDNKSGEHIFIF